MGSTYCQEHLCSRDGPATCRPLCNWGIQTHLQCFRPNQNPRMALTGSPSRNEQNDRALPSHSRSCWHTSRPFYTGDSYHERQCASLQPGPPMEKGLSRDSDPVNNRLFIICPTTQVPRPSQGGNCTRHLFWTKHLLHLYTLRLTQSTHIITTRLDNTIYRSSTISHCLLSNRSTEGPFILFQWLAWANATKRNYV